MIWCVWKSHKPRVSKVFTVKELEESLIDGGFSIDYNWQPSKDKAVFIVGKKVNS